MKGFTVLDDNEYCDECPAHGGEVKAEYNFGQMDATVYTYHGCRCACSVKSECFAKGVYHTSYNAAAGRARLIVAESDVQNAPFK